jgi:hypothetical protein
MANIKRMTQDEFETTISGSEPNFDAKKDILSKLEIVKTLNWYTANRDTKASKKYIVDYFRKNKLKLDESKLNEVTPTFGWLCRMIVRGANLSEDHKNYLNQNITLLKEAKKEKKVVEEPTATVSVRDRVQEKAFECAGEIEGAIDKFILTKYKEEISPLSIMMDKAIKGMHANILIGVYKNQRDQWQNVLDTDDAQIKEGYSNFRKSDIKKLIAYHQRIIDDAQTIIGEAKKTRKPRKRKVKTPEQLIGKLKYCLEDKDLKIKSVDPKNIIAAEAVWIFNRKTRKLGCYFADDSSGLTVKGSTIQNYSEVKSISKTVRKPDEMIPNVINGGKVFLRNVLQEIRAKESKLNGRINKDTMIIRIVK